MNYHYQFLNICGVQLNVLNAFTLLNLTENTIWQSSCAVKYALKEVDQQAETKVCSSQRRRGERSTLYSQDVQVTGQEGITKGCLPQVPRQA